LHSIKIQREQKHNDQTQTGSFEDTFYKRVQLAKYTSKT